MQKLTVGRVRAMCSKREITFYGKHSNICHCLGCVTQRSDLDGQCRCKTCRTYGSPEKALEALTIQQEAR